MSSATLEERTRLDELRSNLASRRNDALALWGEVAPTLHHYSPHQAGQLAADPTSWAGKVRR